MLDIVGAGLSGLLAGNVLRHRNPTLYEVQEALPNNHSAVLRFKTSGIGDVLNIPFRKVALIKATVPWKNPVADALAYSFKNTGHYRSDRSINAGLVTAERWVAPSDLIQRMAAPLTINYGRSFLFGVKTSNPIISTLPMPALMQELSYHRDGIEFNHVEGINVKATIANCDAYVSLLCPTPKIPFSRITITGDELIVESIGKLEETDNRVYAELCVSVASDLLGIELHNFSDLRWFPQRYAKITPIDDVRRKNFLWWATDRYNIFSLGRFATWRPSLLMDDLVNDLRKIDGWIEQGHYSIARNR